MAYQVGTAALLVGPHIFKWLLITLDAIDGLIDREASSAERLVTGAASGAIELDCVIGNHGFKWSPGSVQGRIQGAANGISTVVNSGSL